jgi:hypothetical protein
LSESIIYDVFSILKKENFLGVKYFKIIYFLQYIYFCIRPRLDFKKYVRKFGKRTIRKRHKTGSIKAIKEYMLLLNIIPMNIEISRSYKLGIL